MNENRCLWAKSEILRTYHDSQYGYKSNDDKYLFEMLVLEFMQAGLSFEIILKKRQAMTEAFDGFDFRKIASYDKEKIKNLMENKGIIRNKKKLEALVTNARAFIKVREEFGSFSSYIYSFSEKIIDYQRSKDEIISQSDLSKKISKDMKKRGFSFVGPITIHSYMEAIGIVNCHEKSCFMHEKINKQTKS